jgi:SAM-dependent methyltransferase
MANVRLHPDPEDSLQSAEYRQIRQALAVSYDGGASRRDLLDKPPWKLAERTAFLDRLLAEDRTRLLEIGAGTGQDSAYFASHGLEVVASDLSPAMVERCRAKGLDARVLDFSELDFPAGSFDAVHAMNCLLHVPDADLPPVLAEIARVLRPGGLFFLGVYGGAGVEGPAPDDDHVPPRFFSWRTDEQLQQFARRSFEIVDFHVVQLGQEHRFQSLTLRRPGGLPAL